MRVLLVASSIDDDGGAPVAIGQLAMALADLGHAVEIAGQHTHALAPAITTAARHAGVNVTGFHDPWTLSGQFAAARKASRLVGERAREAAAAGERFVVHTHGVWVLPVIAAGRAARKANVRHVITPHGMLRQEAMRKSGLKKRLAFAAAVWRELAAAVVHVTSRAEADDLRRLVPHAEPVVIPMGIAAPAAAHKQTAPRDQRAAGFLGRIIPIKNLDTLLRAWRGAAPGNWRLRIAGPADAGYARILQRLATDLGLADRVQIEPAIPHDRIGDFLAEIDFFILPSKSESFGMSVGESLAAGVPVIATTAAPWEDVTAHGCGWCADPTQGSLAQAIREATARDAAELAAMGTRGAEWVRRDFHWAGIAQRHVRELYDGEGPKA